MGCVRALLSFHAANLTTRNGAVSLHSVGVRRFAGGVDGGQSDIEVESKTGCSLGAAAVVRRRRVRHGNQRIARAKREFGSRFACLAISDIVLQASVRAAAFVRSASARSASGCRTWLVDGAGVHLRVLQVGGIHGVAGSALRCCRCRRLRRRLRPGCPAAERKDASRQRGPQCCGSQCCFGLMFHFHFHCPFFPGAVKRPLPRISQHCALAPLPPAGGERL